MKLTIKQQALYDYMSEISELSYCAGWMAQTEFRLWSFLTDPSDDGNWGQYPIQPNVRLALQELCDAIGGWIVWHEADAEPSFVDLLSWRKAFADWKQSALVPKRYLTHAKVVAALAEAAEDADDVAIYDARMAELARKD